MSLSPREAAAVTEHIGPDDLAGAAFVTALRDGRRDAYERLVAAYQTPLYNLALRIVRHHDDALDVVQEVFIKALQSLPRTQGSSHVRAWLYRVTINASYDHLRAGKRRPAPADHLHGERVCLVDDIERSEMAHLFSQSLQTLPPRQQVALVLKDVHGLPHAEIAEALGISRGSAEVLLFRARHGFRRCYQELSDDTLPDPDCRATAAAAARSVGASRPPKLEDGVLSHARTCPQCRELVDKCGRGLVGLGLVLPMVALDAPSAEAAAAQATAAGVAGVGVVAGAAAVAGAAGGGSAAVGAGAGALATFGVESGGLGSLGVGAAQCGATASGLVAASQLGQGVGGTFVCAATSAGGLGADVAARVGALVGGKAVAAVVAGVCALTASSVAGVQGSQPGGTAPAGQSPVPTAALVAETTAAAPKAAVVAETSKVETTEQMAMPPEVLESGESAEDAAPATVAVDQELAEDLEAPADGSVTPQSSLLAADYSTVVAAAQGMPTVLAQQEMESSSEATSADVARRSESGAQAESASSEGSVCGPQPGSEDVDSSAPADDSAQAEDLEPADGCVIPIGSASSAGEAPSVEATGASLVDEPPAVSDDAGAWSGAAEAGGL